MASSGLHQSISGPTLIDLTLRFQSSYDDIGRAMSSIGAGIVLSALIGGVLVDINSSWLDTLIAVPQIISTIALLSMPMISTVTALWFMFFALGIAAGMTKIGCQRILVKMWQSEVAVPFHLVHFAFGIGSSMAPVLAEQFLAEIRVDETPGQTMSSNSTIQRDMRYEVFEDSRVELAYVASGIVTVHLSLPFFVFIINEHCYRSKRGNYKYLREFGDQENENLLYTLRKTVDPRTFTGGYRRFGVFTLLCIALYYINSSGGLQGYGNYLRSFSVDKLKFSGYEAVYINAAFWASFTVGRLASTLLAHFISTQNMLLIYTTWHAAAAICLLVFLGTNQTLLWLFTILDGLLSGPMNPAFMSYINSKIDITGFVLTFVTCSQGSGHLIYLWLEGFLYHSYGPTIVQYVEVVSAAMIFLVAVVFIIVAHGRGNIYDGNQTTDDDEEACTETDMNV